MMESVVPLGQGPPMAMTHPPNHHFLQLGQGPPMAMTHPPNDHFLHPTMYWAHCSSPTSPHLLHPTCCHLLHPTSQCNLRVQQAPLLPVQALWVEPQLAVDRAVCLELRLAVHQAVWQEGLKLEVQADRLGLLASHLKFDTLLLQEATYGHIMHI